MKIQSESQHRQLVSRLGERLAAESGEEVEVIETHISSVILAGGFAYKIKKPLDLGFLDFSTLERRRFCCDEEIRLNARLAPQVYLDVVKITGSAEAPVLAGEGEALEYAVRMNRFDQDGLLSTHIELLDKTLIEAIARRVAAFHRDIEVAGADAAFGTPGLLVQPMWHNFEHIRSLVDDSVVLGQIEYLETWTRNQQEALWAKLLERKAGGFIRECHGDLHLGNIALVEGDVLIFDGIEFNPDLRWIDTMSEMGFLLMDLEEKGRPDLAAHALNSYLEVTGDFEGVQVLRFYQVYRAMVRAKVAAIRASQEAVGSSGQASAEREFRDYLSLAERFTRYHCPVLLLTHGVSGSGKSTIASALAGRLSALWLRSDVERKRLAGLAAETDSRSAPGGGIYTPEFTRRTYERLLELSGLVLASGHSVIVDATFLDRDQRQPFYELAAAGGYLLLLLEIDVPETELRRRIGERGREGGDASEADLKVLEKQLAVFAPLEADEMVRAVVISAENPHWERQLLARISNQPD